MRASSPPGSVLVRLNLEQRAELEQMAREADLPLQHLIELRLFGRIAPRERARYRSRRDQPQLPIGSEEESVRKSA